MRNRITLFLTVLTLCLFAPAYAQISQGTVVDPLTGQVSTYNSIQHADGSRSYMWNDPNGHTTTGYLSSGQHGPSNFTTTDTATGQVSYGSLYGGPSRPFLPEPPSRPKNYVPGPDGWVYGDGAQGRQ